MSFHLRPARRENVNVLIALAGASGAGKTYSALALAQGLAGGKPIAFIDTEARRALHYADRFDFLHAEMAPPFRPERFLDAIRAAEAAAAGVIVIDSFSHEHDGEGGLLDWAEQLEREGTKSPGNWREPKAAHKRLMNALLQCRAHLVFCLRADEKIRITQVPVIGRDGEPVIRRDGQPMTKSAVEPQGWVPICEKRFMFEMTASFTLSPAAPGIPQFDLPHKLQEQHRAFFPAGTHIGVAAGEQLRAWAGGVVAAAEAQQSGAEATQAGDIVNWRPLWKTLAGEVQAIDDLSTLAEHQADATERTRDAPEAVAEAVNRLYRERAAQISEAAQEDAA